MLSWFKEWRQECRTKAILERMARFLAEERGWPGDTQQIAADLRMAYVRAKEHVEEESGE